MTIAIAAPAMVVAFAFGGGVASGAGLVGRLMWHRLSRFGGRGAGHRRSAQASPRIPAAVHSWAYLVLLVVAASTVALTA